MMPTTYQWYGVTSTNGCLACAWIHSSLLFSRRFGVLPTHRHPAHPCVCVISSSSRGGIPGRARRAQTTRQNRQTKTHAKRTGYERTGHAQTRRTPACIFEQWTAPSDAVAVRVKNVRVLHITLFSGHAIESNSETEERKSRNERTSERAKLQQVTSHGWNKSIHQKTPTNESTKTWKRV